VGVADLSPPDTQLWLAPPEAAGRMVPARLSAPERARWQSLRGGRRRVEWEASRALLQHVGREGVTSLSHSAGHAAVLVAPSGVRAGVDLETARPRDVVRLASFCYADSEATDGADLETFYLRWTLKEAFAKALGLPLASALRTCVFLRRAGGWTAQVPCSEPWRVAVYAPRPDLVMAAVVVGLAGPAQWECREWPPARAASWTSLLKLSGEGSEAAVRKA
jgi:hypothetical protein